MAKFGIFPRVYPILGKFPVPSVIIIIIIIIILTYPGRRAEAGQREAAP